MKELRTSSDGNRRRFSRTPQWRIVDRTLAFGFHAPGTERYEITHVVAVDLPGFGRFERRDALMTPRAMGEFIVRVADACGLCPVTNREGVTTPQLMQEVQP